jgi:hypothetical protein
MKINAIFRLKLVAGGSGFQPRSWDWQNRVNRGWKPLPQIHSAFFKIQRSFIFDQTGPFGGQRQG